MCKKILVVEDNEMNMKLFCDVVELCGFKAVSLRSGVTAIDVAIKCSPYLVLMDIQLPEISGIELINKFKAHETLKTIPIIAITAFAMKGDEEKIVQTGCEAYISKPICIKNLQEAIKNLIK